MTHTSRANEDVSGGVRRQRVARVPRRRRARLRHRRPAVPRVSRVRRRAEVEGQGALVSTATLARQAERLALGDHLLLGRGEEKTGGRRKQALLADGYEALIAAIYLDGGIEQARAFIAREFAPLLDEVRRARRRRRRTTSRRCRSTCSRATGRCPSTGSSGTVGPGSSQAVSGGGAWSAARRWREAIGPSKKEAEQEAAQAGAREAVGRAQRLPSHDASRVAEVVTSASQSISMMPQRLLVVVGGAGAGARPSRARASAAAAGAAARSGALRARGRLRSARWRGSAAAPRRAAAGR